jgi:predicted ATP-dependent Lon-type protease
MFIADLIERLVRDLFGKAKNGKFVSKWRTLIVMRIAAQKHKTQRKIVRNLWTVWLLVQSFTTNDDDIVVEKAKESTNTISDNLKDPDEKVRIKGLVNLVKSSKNVQLQEMQTCSMLLEPRGIGTSTIIAELIKYLGQENMRGESADGLVELSEEIF